MNPLDKTNKKLSLSFQNVIQMDSGLFYDLLGNQVKTSKKTWSWTAANNSTNTNDIFLKVNSIPSNLAPYVVFTDGFIRGISLFSSVASLWEAEIYINGDFSVRLSSGGYNSSYVGNLSIAFNAGDQISIYCNGTGVNRPSVNILLEEA